jgi:hypothetical protein
MGLPYSHPCLFMTPLAGANRMVGKLFFLGEPAAIDQLRQRTAGKRRRPTAQGDQNDER